MLAPLRHAMFDQVNHEARKLFAGGAMRRSWGSQSGSNPMGEGDYGRTQVN